MVWEDIRGFSELFELLYQEGDTCGGGLLLVWEMWLCARFC